MGMVGRFDPLKDHFNLLDALVKVAEREIDFQCLLVGRGLGAENPTLKERIDDLGLQDRVQLLGQRTDIPAVMNALDLHAFKLLGGLPECHCRGHGLRGALCFYQCRRCTRNLRGRTRDLPSRRLDRASRTDHNYGARVATKSSNLASPKEHKLPTNRGTLLD